jgi:hypothetical protein
MNSRGSTALTFGALLDVGEYHIARQHADGLVELDERTFGLQAPRIFNERG